VYLLKGNNMKVIDNIKTTLKENILIFLEENNEILEVNFTNAKLNQYPTAPDFINLDIGINEYYKVFYVTVNEDNKLVFTVEHSNAFSSNVNKSRFIELNYTNILSAIVNDIFSDKYRIEVISEDE